MIGRGTGRPRVSRGWARAPAWHAVAVAAFVLAVVHAPGLANAAIVRPAPMRPHASLLSSDPSPGASVVAPLARIRLQFNEPVESALTGVAVVTAAGDTLALSPVADPYDVHAVLAQAPALRPGPYTITWHVVSADGHRVDGSFGFILAPTGTAATPSRQAEGLPAAKPPDADTGSWSSPLGNTRFARALGKRPAVPILRSLAITALLSLAGLTLLIATLPISGPRPMRLALVLAVLSTGLLAAYSVVWSATAVGDGRGLAESVSLTASTTPGALEVARVALAFLALWALALARRSGLAAMFSGVAVLITGASGHPAVTSPLISIPAKSIHLAAAALWLGGLMWIVTAERHGARYVEGTRRISSLAFVSVIVVVATGIVQALLFLPHFSALTGSVYGQIILAKTAGLLVLVIFGAFHRRVVPRLDTTMARRRLRGSVRLEIVVMIAVAILGGLLAAISPTR